MYKEKEKDKWVNQTTMIIVFFLRIFLVPAFLAARAPRATYTAAAFATTIFATNDDWENY
jgi:hypothetical protein